MCQICVCYLNIYYMSVKQLSAIYRKQQKFRGTELSRFSRIFNKKRKFSLLILDYGIS